MKKTKLLALFIALAVALAAFFACTKDKGEAEETSAGEETNADGGTADETTGGDGVGEAGDGSAETKSPDNGEENSEKTDTSNKGNNNENSSAGVSASTGGNASIGGNTSAGGNTSTGGNASAGGSSSSDSEPAKPVVTTVVGTWTLTYDYAAEDGLSSSLSLDFTWSLTADGKLTVKQNSVPTESSALPYCREYIEMLYDDMYTEKELNDFAVKLGYEDADEYLDSVSATMAEDMVRSLGESPAEYSGSYTFDGTTLTVDDSLKLTLKAGNGKWSVQSVNGEIDGILIYAGAELAN